MKEPVDPPGLELELKFDDNGAFAEGRTDFRITVFLGGGKRLTGLIKASEIRPDNKQPPLKQP